MPYSTDKHRWDAHVPVRGPWVCRWRYQSVIHGLWDARRMVTFSGKNTATALWLVLISHRTEGRRLSCLRWVVGYIMRMYSHAQSLTAVLIGFNIKSNFTDARHVITNCHADNVEGLIKQSSCERWDADMVMCLQRGAYDLHMVPVMPVPSPSSLASLKSRMVSLFWIWLTQVVL